MRGLVKLCEHFGGLVGLIGLFRDVQFLHRVDVDNRMPAPLASRMRENVRKVLLAVRRLYFIWVWKMDLGEGAVISLSAKLDKTNPRGIHIGRYTVVTFGAAILTHDHVNGYDHDVHIGDDCFIGAHSIILPGVTIGDHCIVSAASIVARNVPAGSLVAGNPARIVESNLKTTHYGVRIPREP